MTIRFSRALAFVAVSSVLVATAASAADSSDPVVATVNGSSIYKSDLVTIQQGISQQRGQLVPLESNYDAFLGEAISDRLMLDQATKEKLEADPDVKKALANNRAKILVRAFEIKSIKKAEQGVTDAAMKERYDLIMQKWQPKPQVKVAHIFVESEDVAKTVIADLKSGISWDDEAKAKGKDGTKDRGGEIGWIEKGQGIQSEFDEAAFKLKVGEVSPTPIRTNSGWHVIKVEDSRMSPQPLFDQVKEEVRTQLAREAVAKTVASLQASAKINRFNLDGSPMQAAAKP